MSEPRSARRRARNEEAGLATRAPNSHPALLQTYASFPFVLDSAQGETLRAEDGAEYLDFYGGHCVCCTGHGHPVVRAALHAQLDKLLFYSTAAEVRIREEAADALVRYAGDGMAGAFFCNSGSEANENALKLAVKLTGRKRFLAFRGSFHGRTLLALSVTDDAKLRAPYADLLAPVDFLDLNDYAALERADLSGIAAAIIEPVQSMAGVKMAERQWLALLRKRCTESGALLVFDEVQTGFARLGAPFAAQYFGVEPDMLTVAKSMASGFPMGALLVSGAVAAQVAPGDLGSTFGGGPLACAALLATLEVIEDEDLAARSRAAYACIRDGLKELPWLTIRGTGLLLGLDAGVHAATLKAYLYAKNIIVGGSNDPHVLRLMPPLNISDAGITRLIQAIHEFSAQLEGNASEVQP